MNFLETKHKKKSAVITAIVLALILVGIFNFGMQYLDPPEEYGLAINFGDSNIGNGDPVVETKENPVVKKVEEKIEEKEEVIPKETIKEEVITQDIKDAPVLEKPKKKKVEEPKKEVKKIEKPKEIPKPKPSKETQDALNNLLKGNSKNGENKGEGDDDNPGLKGDKNGDPKSTKYYGNNGSGGDKNYNLAGRNALSKPIEKPECNEEGIVVVSIEVDNTGKVIRATPGVKGSTNTAKCLLDPAKTAALKTTWNADPKAPNKQKGTIIYRFSLSE
ncbi:energy transducer TonB family protein [Polaribacter uvawellassae]|uniref:energy transducer TonB family protein n=1 Tax=Polaribacter uvawellassae TaxID=3133495 RepID=UPI003219B5AA